MSRRMLRFVSSLLVCVCILSLATPAIAKPVMYRQGDLAVQVVVDEATHLVVDVHVSNVGQIITFDYTLNPEAAKGVLQSTVREGGGRLLYSGAPYTIPDQSASLDGQEFAQALLSACQQVEQGALGGEAASCGGGAAVAPMSIAIGILLIPFGAALFAALQVVLANNWPAITAAGTVFQSAPLMYEWFRDNVLNVYINYSLTYSASNHIAENIIKQTVSNDQVLSVYTNTSGSTLLLVLSMQNGLVGNIARSLGGPYHLYDLLNFNLSGYYLFVLYDPNTHQIFHAHIRSTTYRNQDVEYTRYKNHLSIRLLPTPAYEPQYNSLVNPINPCPTDQTAK